MKLATLLRKERSPFELMNVGLDDLLSGSFAWPHAFAYPAVNVTEDTNRILVEAELPGVAAADIDVRVENNILTISGEKKEEKTVEGKSVREISYGAFQRSIALPADVDAAKVEAECRNGVLRISMEKSERAKAISIKVKGE